MKEHVFHSIYTSFPCQSGGGNGQSIAYLYKKDVERGVRKNKNYIENMRIKQENPSGGNYILIEYTLLNKGDVVSWVRLQKVV